MIYRMPLLNGPRVRHLAAERGWDLPTLARKADLNPRTLANTTRPDSPQPASLVALYALADALKLPDQDRRDVAASIVNDPQVAAEIRATKETEQPKREPTGPAKRKETSTGTGPKRPDDEYAPIITKAAVA
jgi:transcriptional regulator with XRE-family HTH domain